MSWPGVSRLLTPPCLPAALQWGLFQERAGWDCGLNTWLTQLRPLYKFKILGVGVEILILSVLKDSLVSKLPGNGALPPTNQVGLPFSSTLSLPSSPGASVRTNTYWSIKARLKALSQDSWELCKDFISDNQNHTCLSAVTLFSLPLTFQ